MSRWQIVVYTFPPVEWKEGKIATEVNHKLARAKWKIRIRTVEGIRGGFFLFPDEVPGQDDLAVLQSLFEQSFKDEIAAGTRKIKVEIPTSKSCLKICDFSFHNGLDAEGKPAWWTADKLPTVLAQTPHGSQTLQGFKAPYV